MLFLLTRGQKSKWKIFKLILRFKRTCLPRKTFSLNTLAHFGLVYDSLSTRNSKERKVFFNTNVEFLKVFLISEIWYLQHAAPEKVCFPMSFYTLKNFETNHLCILRIYLWCINWKSAELWKFIENMQKRECRIFFQSNLD